MSKVSVAPTSAAVTAGEFNFQEYMMGRADDVNTALDQCLPMAYPESVHEVRPLPTLVCGSRNAPRMFRQRVPFRHGRPVATLIDGLCETTVYAVLSSRGRQAYPSDVVRGGV